MKRFLSLVMLLLVFCSIARGQASPTCSQTDVQNTLNAAARNATVTVPLGNCSWSSGVTITKGVTLNGAGAGSTVITNTGGNITMLQISPDATAIASSETIKVNGFTFDGGGNQFSMIGVTGADVFATKPYRYYIITNNTFRNSGSVGGAGDNAVQVNQQARGVISHNTFDRCEFPFRSFGKGGGGDTREFTNTAYVPFSLGTTDSNYFEGNTILWSSSYTSNQGAPGWIESGQGGRLVVRFNTWNFANANGQSELWDIHGNQNFQGHNINGQTSTMMAEYLNNTITNYSSSVYRLIDHRGGWGIFVNNSFSGASTPSIHVNQYANGNQGTSGCYNQMVNPDGSTYTGPDLTVANSYFINQTINGVITGATFDSGVNGCGVVENGAISPFGTLLLTGWWNHNAACSATTSCTTGVGYGTVTGTPTSTCTTGVGFWATNQGSWNTSGSGGQGQLYKCISTNNWQLFYTPLQYPHPLLGGSGTPAATPSPTSLTFTSQLVSIASPTQAVTLTNGGTATLSITSIVSSGDFSQSNNCGASLNAAASCTITVTFTPTLAGQRIGTITITDNASDSPQSVALTGTGVGTVSGIGNIQIQGNIKINP